MSKSIGKCLRVLIVFLVATSFTRARAQTEPPLNPNPSQPGTMTNTACGEGDLSACNASPTQQGQPLGTTSSPSLAYPGLYNAGGPNAPGSVYRDDALGLNRTTEPRQRAAQPLKPQPLTEFQMLVAGSIGRIVPVYGADLFTNVPDTFAPVQRLPVTPEYVIGPGDELLIRTWGQVSQNLHLTVDRSGSVYVPQVGEIRVAGFQFQQLQPILKARFDRVYRNYDMNVNLGELRSIQVFVTGEARRPGSYTISSLSTLVNAVFACGGPAPHGSLRHILLKRAGTQIADFDLYDLLLKGDKSKDANLETGDVIYFSPAGAQVAVVGSVLQPAIYELRGRESVAEALALAGGVSAVADSTSLVIERTEQHSDGSRARIAVDVSMNQTALATPLQNADIVRVRATSARFDKTVTLRGYVATPGRFAWHPGMKVSDLIPNQDALLTPDYWLRREQLGLPVADFQPMMPPVNVENPPTQTGQPVPRPVTPQDTQTIDSGLFPQLSEGVTEESSATQGKTEQYQSLAASESGSSPNGATAESAAGREALGTGPRLVTTPSFPIQTQVVKAAPDIDWNYAVVERLDPKTLTTQLLPFSLGAVVLHHDASADVTLEPGDVITVFSDADIRVPREEQTKYVRLEGEFVHAGVYSAKPGETLRQLVIRAGGLTPQAYLYGSQFSRESARREQQQRLEEYVSALSYQIELTASNKATSVVSPNEAATMNASVASQRALVSRLRELRATGRVVLHIEPFDNNLTALPDLPLEDGDRFIVPPVPSTVGIVGAVYDPNFFVYASRMRAGDYLRTAGGPNKNADKKQIFIIRADGSVSSRQYLQHTLWTGDNFDHQVIYPGDTIIVPTQLNKITVLRGLTDWSAVFSQFALGAAAINVLK